MPKEQDELNLELYQRWRDDRDGGAIAELWDRYRYPLERIAARWSNLDFIDRESAVDATLDVLLSAQARIERSVWLYLKAVLSHELADRYQRAALPADFPGDDVAVTRPVPSEQTPDAALPYLLEAEAIVASTCAVFRAAAATRGEPRSAGLVVVALLRQRHTVADIAAASGVARETLSSWKRRFLAVLREAQAGLDRVAARASAKLNTVRKFMHPTPVRGAIPIDGEPDGSLLRPDQRIFKACQVEPRGAVPLLGPLAPLRHPLPAADRRDATPLSVRDAAVAVQGDLASDVDPELAIRTWVGTFQREAMRKRR